ncbi:RNA polymerase sigma factor [Paraliomyxa miuraensis]|uniref:RNA polymerase sigma factor n=1 Tax=Paraliomyxa miuraensis TaxID=376150 RepID=UPI002255B4EB|nr:sigma-70 family RNA polymerase sigma factor [Paraliomyxa miuraensis]MCX4242700.1 sigma-70 family RNA polymerase sigma factor [Paraliomyxa miuraensis]
MSERSRERDLLLAWRDGDRKAGSELIRGHARLVQRFFGNKVGKPELVEELAQRTFAACVAGVERFRGDSNFRTWLFAVANNVLREHYREQQRGQSIDFGTVSVEGSSGGPSSVVASSEEQRRLLTALRRISIDSQVLLELYYWEELTAPELAEVFSIPVGTVRGRIGKAKLELRAELDTMERTRERPPTTEAELEDWARQVREQMK